MFALFVVYIGLCGCLFENQLCEVVEAILPDDEVVLSVRIVDERARNAVLITESLELYAVAQQSISTAAYHPKKFVLFLHLVHIRNELCCTLCIGC